MKNRFLTKSMITAVLLGGALSFTSCNDEFNEKDFLNQQYDLAEKKSAADYARKLQEIAVNYKNKEAFEKLQNAIKKENRAEYLKEYQKAGLVKKINFITLDKVTGKPVAGVKVNFLGIEATSDEQGVATLENVPVGAGDTFITAPKDYFSATAPAYNPYTQPRIVGVSGGQDAYWVKEVTQVIKLIPKSSVAAEYTTLKGTMKMDIDMTNDTLEDAPDGVKLMVDYSGVAGIGEHDATVGTSATTTTEFTFYAYFINDDQGLPTETTTKGGAYSVKVPAMDDIKLIVARELEQEITYINKSNKKVKAKGYFNLPSNVSNAYEDTEAQKINLEKMFAFKFSVPEAKDFDLKYTNTFEPYGVYGAGTATSVTGVPNDKHEKDIVNLGVGFKAHPTITATGLNTDDKVALRGNFEVKTNPLIGNGRTAFSIKTGMVYSSEYNVTIRGAHGALPSSLPATFRVYGKVNVDGVEDPKLQYLGDVTLKIDGGNVVVDDSSSNNALSSHFISKYNDESNDKYHHSVEIAYVSYRTTAALAVNEIATADILGPNDVPATKFGAIFNYKERKASGASTDAKSTDPYKLYGIKVIKAATAPSYTAYPTFKIEGGSPSTPAQFVLNPYRKSQHKVTIANAGTGYIKVPNIMYYPEGMTDGTATKVFATDNGQGEFTVDASGQVQPLLAEIKVALEPAEAASEYVDAGSNIAAKGTVAFDNKKNKAVKESMNDDGHPNYPAPSTPASRKETKVTSGGTYKAKPTHTFKPVAKYASWAADHEVTPAEFSYKHSTSTYKVYDLKVVKGGKYIDVYPMPYTTSSQISHEKSYPDLKQYKGKDYVHNFILPMAKLKK